MTADAEYVRTLHRRTQPLLQTRTFDNCTMKYPAIAALVICALVSLSCEKDYTLTEYHFQVFYNFDDPVARALGEIRAPYPSHGTFDVGVAVQRTSWLFSDYVSTTAGMAFNVNGYPANARSATIDTASMLWYSYYLPGDTLGVYRVNVQDTALQHSDSLRFGYVSLSGDAFQGKAAVMPPFVNVGFPDTVSMSKGWTITYDNGALTDSVLIRVHCENTQGDVIAEVQFQLQDNGKLVVPPSALPQDARIEDLQVELVRKIFTTQTSPTGKRIGVYADVTCTVFCDAVR